MAIITQHLVYIKLFYFGKYSNFNFPLFSVAVTATIGAWIRLCVQFAEYDEFPKRYSYTLAGH